MRILKAVLLNGIRMSYELYSKNMWIRIQYPDPGERKEKN
jgi:hypothetical protein